MEKAKDATAVPSLPPTLKPELGGATLLISSLFSNMQPQTPDGQKSRHEDYTTEEEKAERKEPVLCPRTPEGEEKPAELPSLLWAPLKQIQHEKSSTEDTAASPRRETKEGRKAELLLPLLVPEPDKSLSLSARGTSPSFRTKPGKAEGKGREVSDGTFRAEEEERPTGKERRFLKHLVTNAAETTEGLDCTATAPTETSPGRNDGGCVQCSENSLGSTVSALREIPDTDSDSTTYSPDDPQQLLDLYFHLAKKIEGQKAEGSPPSVATLANASTNASASVTPIASSSWPRLPSSLAPATPPLPYRSSSRERRLPCASETNSIPSCGVGDAAGATGEEDEAYDSSGELVQEPLPGSHPRGSRSSYAGAGSYFLRKPGGRGLTAGPRLGRFEQEASDEAVEAHLLRQFRSGGTQSVNHRQRHNAGKASLVGHEPHRWDEALAFHPDDRLPSRGGTSPQGRTARADSSGPTGKDPGHRARTWRFPETGLSPERSCDVRDTPQSDRLSGVGAASLNFQVLSKLLFGGDDEERGPRWEQAGRSKAPEGLSKSGQLHARFSAERDRLRVGKERSSTPGEWNEVSSQQDLGVDPDEGKTDGRPPGLERAYPRTRDENHEQEEPSGGKGLRATKRQGGQRAAASPFRLPTWQQQLLHRDGSREAEGTEIKDVVSRQRQGTRRQAYKESTAFCEAVLPSCDRGLCQDVDPAGEEELGVHTESGEGQQGSRRWAVTAGGHRTWNEVKTGEGKNKRELVSSRGERRGGTRQGGTRKRGLQYPSEDDNSMEGDLAADVDEEKEVLRKIFLLGRARKHAGIHTGRALRSHGSASPRWAAESNEQGETSVTLGTTGIRVNSDTGGQPRVESGFSCAGRRRGAAKKRAGIHEDKEDESWVPPGEKETRESKTRGRSGQEAGLRNSHRNLPGMPSDSPTSLPSCDESTDRIARRIHRERPLGETYDSMGQGCQEPELFPNSAKDDFDAAALDSEDPRNTVGGLIVPVEEEPLSQQQVALLNHIYEVLSKSEEYFSFKSALYQLHIKRHLKSCVSGSTGGRHSQNNTKAIRLFPFMPAVPINEVEQRALLGVRKHLESCGGFALVQSVSGQQVVEEMDELLTSLINKLLLIIVVKYQTCFIHAPARAQLREFLVSFVFPGDLATQMLFRDHVQTVVHARIRHFRDSVGRTLRQHQPATRRRCGIGANLPSSCPSGVEVVSMTPNLRRDQHSETEGHYAGTATLRSVSSPECYFCPSTLLQDGEERRQAKVEDEQRGTEMDYSAGPRTAARKAGSPGTDPDPTSEKERRRMDISHGVNSDFSEDTCRVVVPLWDDPNGAEQEEDRRKGYQVPSEQERRALTLTGRSQSRERSQPTPAQLTDGFHGSGRRARRNSGRPGPDQLFQQLQRVVQLARENGGAKGLESIWHQQPAQVEALLRLAEDVDETVGPKNNTDDRCQGAADPETHTSVGKVGRGEFGTRLPGVGERVGEASDDGPTRSRTKRRRGEEDCGEELEECNLARVSRDSDLSARSSSSCWRGETGRVANSDASRLVKGECAADLPGNSRVSRQTRSSGGNAEPEGQTRGEATLSSRRSWRAQASDVKDDEQPGNTHAETETAQTNRWTPQGQSWERLESKNPLRRKAAPNAECREKPHSGVGEVQTELSNSRGEFMSCGSDNGTSDCTRRATRQRGPGCDDKDPADLPPYLPTSDEATPAARSVVSGGTTTSSSTRHAAGVEDKKERTVSSTDDLPRSVLTEFLLTYCADSSKPTATTSDACKQTVKNPRVTGGKRSHRGVENSIETPAETS